MAITGVNAERKVIDRKKKESVRGGYCYYAHDNYFPKDNNNVPSEYLNEIVCGDSLEVLKNLPDNCIDLIFTSPPYNFGLSYNTNDDTSDWENYFNKLFAIFDECIRIVKFC